MKRYCKECRHLINLDDPQLKELNVYDSGYCHNCGLILSKDNSFPTIEELYK